ncbi:MAG: hypothetical protein IPM61_02390 [Chlorobi bacterium]|nr:MAG: hypothetical protein UZ07_CHB004003275 [Chlorobi bacterium OLB7]MBK8910154.1 hypothetical protein [Chlorobiota bacterium]MBX7217666.1 hypothetical protein [Candidatus Kapabacteria bacterium]
MKKLTAFLLPPVVLAALVAGCGGAEEPKPEVKNYTEYNDPILKFGVKYPEGWTQTAQQGVTAAFYSGKNLYDAFTTFNPENERGAKIVVGALPGGQTAMDANIKEFAGQFDAGVVKGPEDANLNGMAAKKLSYSFDAGNTKYTSERFYVMEGDVVSFIEAGVIGTWENYKPIFDQVFASFKPGKMEAAAPTPAPGDTTGGAVRDSIVTDPPSAEMKSFSGAGYSISYPANFKVVSAGNGKQFIGTRVDSYVMVDQIDPKGMTLEQSVDQLKKSYGGRAPSAANVGGQKGYVFNYSGGKDVASRAYFAMSGGKIIRVTMNWYRPQQDLYGPAFDKMMGSLSIR